MKVLIDRELLELAAKAAGYDTSHRWNAERLTLCPPVADLCINGVSTAWNPLESDADALRLAVKLNMGISIPVFKEPRADVITFRNSLVNVIEKGDDPYAATRRAIVRVAAEIGKEMS